MSETNIQYGVRYPVSGDTWYGRESAARVDAAGSGLLLIAREVGEPYVVHELPTAPGSVIHDSLCGYLVLDVTGKWANSCYELQPEDYTGPGWALVYDNDQSL